MNPLNLTLRFGLELAALASVALWAGEQAEGMLSVLYMVSALALFLGIWGTFNVLDDPSRSGKAPIQVPGVVRLCIELILLGLGVCALYVIGYEKISFAVALLIGIHYLFSYKRIMWLLSR